MKRFALFFFIATAAFAQSAPGDKVDDQIGKTAKPKNSRTAKRRSRPDATTIPPAAASKPANPMEPGIPSDPNTPISPKTPVSPTAPRRPVKPTDPTRPEDPTKPTVPPPEAELYDLR